LNPPAEHPRRQSFLARVTRYDVLGLALLCFIVPSVTKPIMTTMLGLHSNKMRYSDYPSHSAYAAQMRHELRLLLPHPLYHLCLLGVQKGVEWANHKSYADLELPEIGNIRDTGAEILQPINKAYSTASYFVITAFLLLTAAIVWWQLRLAFGVGGFIHVASNLAATAAVVGLVIALMLITPAAFRHAQDAQYYLGYIGINVWHSPTVIVAKPLSYLLFLCALPVFAARALASDGPASALPQDRCPNVLAILAAALIVLLCALAKPNYLLCLLPALASLAWLEHFILRRPIDWRLLILGIVLPAVAILAWQYYFTFAAGSANGVEFAAFKVMGRLSRHLGQKFFFSILFPLACYLVFFPSITRNLRVNLAALAFVVGLGFTYLVAEKRNFTDGNFIWGAQLALFILCTECVAFIAAALRRNWNGPPRQRWITIAQAAFCFAVFGLHLYWGIRYREYLLHAPRGIYQ
jgi:hypothetical protein